jgi:processive 1,2-diacylglycerol beta-glucosyltransferase
VKILGLSREIDQLMGCADLLISKPGGLTTSEALARGLPMVIVNPIPGQESRNSDYLLESGAAVKVNHVCTLTAKINELLAQPDRLQQLRAKARAIGHPTAAFDVARRSLAVIGIKSEVAAPSAAHA